MRTEPIEETYFNWLCAKVVDQFPPIYTGLMRVLFQTEFVWLHPMDHNRAEDGVELRTYFLNETGLQLEQDWFFLPCSMLEFFIAFAIRGEWQTDEPLRIWFWRFMAHLRLDEFRRVSEDEVPAIMEIISTLVYRTYSQKGVGGLFPLVKPKEDQRQVELWYQLFAWMDENIA